jgi:hypothetical protein
LEHLTVKLPERSAVTHDLGVFDDWHLITNEPAIQFEAPRGRWRGGRVTVVEVGDSTVEKTTGVDLVYYNEEVAGFVLVQYKRMRGSPERYQLADQRLQRQREAMRSVPTGERRKAAPADVRIGSSACFLKVCKGVIPVVRQPVPKLIEGLYLPIDLVDALIESGVQSVGYHPEPTRHITNTDFIGLVKGGWIGTRGLASEPMRELVVKHLGEGARVLLSSGRRY